MDVRNCNILYPGMVCRQGCVRELYIGRKAESSWYCWTYSFQITIICIKHFHQNNRGNPKILRKRRRFAYTLIGWDSLSCVGSFEITNEIVEGTLNHKSFRQYLTPFLSPCYESILCLSVYRWENWECAKFRNSCLEGL